jgi:uncharacterized delta-60 repeat protein
VLSGGGALDPTFNGGAPETSGVMDLANATAIQPDGKTVAVGRQGTGTFNMTPKLAIARYNPDGSPDATFGSGGVVSAAADTTGNGVLLQPDGKILVCGKATVQTKGVTSAAYLVARYNANGTLDTTFGSKGTYTWNYGPGNDEASEMGLLPDGSILVAGGANGNQPGGSSASVFKLSRTGALITSFGTNGIFLTNPGNAGSAANAIVVAPNGDAILAGGTHLSTSGGMADAGLIVAVTPAGRLDTTFSGTGYVATLGPGYGALSFGDAVIQGSNLVVCGGPTGNQLQAGRGGLLARYSLAGALDASFGTGGYFTTSDTFKFNAIALEPDGSIVAGGVQFYDAGDVSPYNEMAFALLTRDGAVDTSFGTLGTGFVYVQAGPQSEVLDLVVTGDGRIVAVGYGYTTGRVASLVRLTAP